MIYVRGHTKMPDSECRWHHIWVQFMSRTLDVCWAAFSHIIHACSHCCCTATKEYFRNQTTSV